MRIISGVFRGKKILQPSDNSTRPLKDLTKESIFNIIKHSNKFKIDFEKSYVLDLFSGVGSFGLECISRGVKFVTFVENYKEVLPILKKNLNNLTSVNNYKIIEKDILNNFNFNSLNQKFDIIFLDPPYKEKKLLMILNEIIESKILSNKGIIIIHRHKKELDEFPKNLKIIEEKKYGISKIIFAII
jgi:16S rRNA (guanine966-N2)-methyltransferase